MKVLFVRTRPLMGAESSTIRAISTIKTLLAAGCDVTVLTTDINGTDPQPDLHNMGVDFVYVPMAGAYSSLRSVKSSQASGNKISPIKAIVLKLKKIYRELNVIDPLKMAVSNANKVMDLLKEKYDVVISCSDPKSSHLLAQKVIKNGLVYGKYIEIWGDPLCSDISRRFLVPRSHVKNVEKKIIKAADMVLYVSPATLEQQQEMFSSQANKMKLLLPTYAERRIGDPIGTVKSLGYFGDYTSNIRNILPLYEAVLESGLKAVFCGSSDVKLEETENIEIHERMSRKEVAVYENGVDVLVCLANRSGKQIPGKIYQYAATNKPILVINDGDMNFEQYFEKYNRFVFCKNTKESIVQTINQMKKRTYEELMPIDEFYYEYQVDVLRRMLEE